MNLSNGRVNILGKNHINNFHLQDKIHIKEGDNFYRTALTGGWDTNELSDTFFSVDNIENLQNGIIDGVLKQSKGRFKISKQDYDTLKIIMRSIFLQNAKNKKNDIDEQISVLNNLVLSYCIPQIIGEAIGYLKYKQDASFMHTPMTNPVSTYSNNSLELKPWF